MGTENEEGRWGGRRGMMRTEDGEGRWGERGEMMRTEDGDKLVHTIASLDSSHMKSSDKLASRSIRSGISDFIFSTNKTKH